MKKLVLITTFILSSSGCATWIPAAAKQLDDGSYRIITTGNSFASQEKMKAKVEAKALKVCGEKGYKVIQAPSLSWKKQKDYSTGMVTSYQQAEMIVKCE